MNRKRAYEDRPYRNYEGYADPTAYIAIRNSSKERTRRRDALIILEKDGKRKENTGMLITRKL